ncbi:MAG: GIY-YIG nuclease family protein [Flavobacteriaceae bacterium]|nr:GIY-YIG nuclease family protein [Flavobacteriaceae bacterium]
MKYYCYILSNKNRTVLYIGFTDNLERRLKQHKTGNGASFTKKDSAY